MKFKLPNIKLPKIDPRFKSRKLWLSLFSAIFPILNQHLGWGFDEVVILQVIGSLMGFVTIEGIADVVGRFNGKS